MLDTLDGFESLKSGAATIRMDPDEAPVLGLYAGPLAAKALAEMRGRYGIDPKGEVTIQIFPRHDDFAVRTTGLMGMCGALGASFGSVVTQDSPRSINRPPGSFNWQATMWHELAHVFTLQLSNQRVPRWVTEGISVYEEGLADPSWSRDSELGFAFLYSQGKALKLAELNSGFASPDMVSLAYFQSSLVVSLIVERYGAAALREMVRAFADGVDVETALQKATKTSLADLQTGVRREARAAVRRGRQGAAGCPTAWNCRAGGTVESWTALAAKHTGSYQVQMAAGQALASANAREAAIAAYERAAALVPIRGRRRKPAREAGRSRGARRRRPARAARALVARRRRSHEHRRRAEARAARASGSATPSAAALAWTRIVVIDPFDAAAHTALGRIGIEKKDGALALREFRAALAAGPADPAPAHCDLAEALLMNGQRAEAKKEVARRAGDRAHLRTRAGTPAEDRRRQGSRRATVVDAADQVGPEVVHDEPDLLRAADRRERQREGISLLLVARVVGLAQLQLQLVRARAHRVLAVVEAEHRDAERRRRARRRRVASTTLSSEICPDTTMVLPPRCDAEAFTLMSLTVRRKLPACEIRSFAM